MESVLCTFGLSWDICTSETAANPPVLSDTVLIRIILYQKTNGIAAKGKLIVHVSFCLEGLLW